MFNCTLCLVPPSLCLLHMSLSAFQLSSRGIFALKAACFCIEDRIEQIAKIGQCSRFHQFMDYFLFSYAPEDKVLRVILLSIKTACHAKISSDNLVTDPDIQQSSVSSQ